MKLNSTQGVSKLILEDMKKGTFIFSAITLLIAIIFYTIAINDEEVVRGVIMGPLYSGIAVSVGIGLSAFSTSVSLGATRKQFLATYFNVAFATTFICILFLNCIYFITNIFFENNIINLQFYQTGMLISDEYHVFSYFLADLLCGICIVGLVLLMVGIYSQVGGMKFMIGLTLLTVIGTFAIYLKGFLDFFNWLVELDNMLIILTLGIVGVICTVIAYIMLKDLPLHNLPGIKANKKNN